MPAPKGADSFTPEAFWSLADRSAGPGACWPWKGWKSSGYGQLVWRDDAGRPEQRFAHSVAFELENGWRPNKANGQVVRHTCHRRDCVNPGHLVAGTDADNVADTVEAQRHSHGEKNGQAKLTAEAVAAARKQARTGVGHREIAKAMGVSRPTLTKAINRKTWKHVP